MHVNAILYHSVCTFSRHQMYSNLEVVSGPDALYVHLITVSCSLPAPLHTFLIAAYREVIKGGFSMHLSALTVDAVTDHWHVVNF